MNKREFVAGGMAAVVAAPALAQPPAGAAKPATLGRLLSRTQRLPDLVERPGADAFEAYVGEPFAVVGATGPGEQLIVAAVERVGRCPATEQFTVAFAPAVAGRATASRDGLHLLMHPTGQRLALRLERTQNGYEARFNLLT
jgi:hypothetical protein